MIGFIFHAFVIVESTAEAKLANITINEVAEHAGVSRATVSRVLNDHAYVSDDVRERVQQAMTHLGYRPKRAARQLKTSASNIIGLIIPDIRNTVFQAVVRGVEDAAYANEFNVVLCNTDDTPERQNAYLHMMQSESAAGIIVVPTHPGDGKILTPVRNSGIPIVLLDRDAGSFDADMIKVDNVSGAYLATQHLINIGYDRIAIIAGSQDLTPGHERLRGYRDALGDASRSIDETLIKIGDFRYEDGVQLTHELLDLQTRPDALFVTNNLMTMGALRALHEREVRIPDDVALVGFDDMPWAGDFNPPLTNIAQPAYEIGQHAIDLLLRRIDNPDAAYQKVLLQAKLIERVSCGTPFMS